MHPPFSLGLAMIPAQRSLRGGADAMLANTHRRRRLRCCSPSTALSRPRPRTCGPWWSGEHAVRGDQQRQLKKARQQAGLILTGEGVIKSGN